MSEPAQVGRRVFLLTAASQAVVLGCGGGASSGAPSTDASPLPSCAKASNGPGLPACLSAKVTLTFPGAANMSVGEVALMALDDHSAAIVARDERGFYALSATCTHACCTVALCSGPSCNAPILSPNDCGAPKRGALVREGPAFLCPCHGSAFSASGSVLAGPALSPLPSIAVHIVGPDIVADLSLPVASDQRV